MAPGVWCSCYMVRIFLAYRATIGPVLRHRWERVVLRLDGDGGSFKGGSFQFVPIPVVNSESGYSGMLAAESSCLDSQVSAAGSSFSLRRGSDTCSGSPKAVVSTVGKGSGACTA